MEKKTLREIYNLYIESCCKTGITTSTVSFKPIKSIMYYLEKKKDTLYLTQDLFNEWIEQKKRTYNEMKVVRKFLFYCKERGYFDIKCPRPISHSRLPKRVLDRPLKETVVSNMLMKYFKWRDKSIPLNSNYKYILIRFNNYVYDSWLNAEELTNEMIDEWCELREKESAVTRNIRVSCLSGFLEYGQSHGWVNIKIPQRFHTIEKRGQYSHVFTHEELAKFFSQCDKVEKYQRESISGYRRRRLIFSVIFRFLYSTGMKLIDTIELKRSSVDLEKGILSFDTYNGRRHQEMAIASSLLDLLRRYDTVMDKLLPNREYFFPNNRKGHIDSSYIQRWFVKIWYTLTDVRASISDFRTTFAIENINSWDDDGTEWTLQLLHLSHAMGHESMKITQNYLNMVPRYRDILTTLSGQNLNKLLPNINELIENEEESN